MFDFSSARRPPPSWYVLGWPFLCMHMEKEVSGVSFSFDKDINAIGSGPHPMTSFNLNFLIRKPVLHWGLGFEHMKLMGAGEGTMQSITVYLSYKEKQS